MRVDIDKLEALEKALEDADQEIAALRTQLEQARFKRCRCICGCRETTDADWCLRCTSAIGRERDIDKPGSPRTHGKLETLFEDFRALRTQLEQHSELSERFAGEADKMYQEWQDENHAHELTKAKLLVAEARETALNAEIAALREHQKGIVQGASPLEVAERILAEHDDNIPRGASRQKLDDELCRMCALASTIKTGAERETALRESLEEIERIVTTTGGPQLHMIMKIRDAIARALSGEGRP
jgi:uncharacterized protein YukE